jgi:hypothetical protein
MERSLDIFALAGASRGDHFNVRATFNNTNAGEPAFLAFCRAGKHVLRCEF